MADYAKMYRTLFNAITDAITTLQAAQLAVEEMYLSAEEPSLALLGSAEDSGARDAPPTPPDTPSSPCRRSAARRRGR